MYGKRNRKTKTIHRRLFVGNSVKILTLGPLLMPVMQACKNKKSTGDGATRPDSLNKKTTHTTGKKKRKKWSHEGLAVNTKTNVLHLPSLKIYTYYDEIKSTHLLALSIAAWNPRAENAPKLNRQQSGNILEVLSLSYLKQGINDEYLDKAINTLSLAFTPDCDNSKKINLNIKNFRLHELMLQYIALHSGISPAEKWPVFNQKIKKPALLHKRHQWMANENNFNERIKYISDRQSEYMNRLTERARKYSFS